MGDQEFLQDEDSMSILRSMLHLSTAAVPAKTAATEPLDGYTTAYINSSTKRNSSSSPSQFQEPVAKRATLHPPSPPSATSTAVDYHLLGYTKLQLPHSFPEGSSAPLRRTVSEPIYSTGTANPSAPPPKLVEVPTSPIPVLNHPRQISSNRNLVQESIQFPNVAPGLHRTAASKTPPRPPAGRNSSMSPSCGESPSTKRLKRMRERLKEMNEWWNQVVSEEGDEDDSEPENCCCNDNNPKEEYENHMENPSQEAVWVEKNGESLVLHFKCPCDKGYEVLLAGKSCYYKLTNF